MKSKSTISNVKMYNTLWQLVIEQTGAPRIDVSKLMLIIVCLMQNVIQVKLGGK